MSSVVPDVPAPAPSIESRILDFFDFHPSKAAAIVGLVLFTLVGVAVLVRTVQRRTWWMVIPTVVAWMEMGGYACRIRMFTNPLRGVFIAMQCLLIIPPSFLALADYWALGKTVAALQAADPHIPRKRLQPRWITWAFFVAELVSLTAQGAGAGLSVGGDNTDPSDQSSTSAGRILLIVGLAALIFIILCFIATAVSVWLAPAYAAPHAPALRRIFAALAATTFLLLWRNIFRLIEFTDGWYGSIATREWLFYCFDALLIFLWISLMVPLHFGALIQDLNRQLAASAAGPGAKSPAGASVHAGTGGPGNVQMA